MLPRPTRAHEFQPKHKASDLPQKSRVPIFQYQYTATNHVHQSNDHYIPSSALLSTRYETSYGNPCYSFLVNALRCRSISGPRRVLLIGTQSGQQTNVPRNKMTCLVLRTRQLLLSLFSKDLVFFICPSICGFKHWKDTDSLIINCRLYAPEKF